MARQTKYPNKAGIYKFTCKLNGKIYIGKSVNLRIRIPRHKYSKGRCYFERAILKHGWDSFTVEILEIFEDFVKDRDNDTLLERESNYMKMFDSTNKDKGYNVCKYSTDCTGFHHSDESKEKIRLGNLGKKMSPESIEKTRQANLGRKNSDETKEKMRNSHLGKTCSEETREKFKNREYSDDTREKLRNVHLGKPKSAEHIEKVRQANIGRKHSEESKEKMRQAKLNKRNQSIKTEV